MTLSLRAMLLTMPLVCILATACHESMAAPPTTEPSTKQTPPLPSLDVARGQASLLHETIHATLQIVHHQYYREDEGLMLPAATLRNVFGEVARRQNVELRWLAINAQAMNVDHVAQSKFEKDAVAALSSGQTSFEQADGKTYRHVGAITLTSDCLKCHVPSRTSTRDRIAGLLISIPYKNN